MMNIVKTPFTPDQIEKLNDYQHNGKMHPFTGDPSSVDVPWNSRRDCPDHECLLIATQEGWVCPCGKYKQSWAHEFQAK